MILEHNITRTPIAQDASQGKALQDSWAAKGQIGELLHGIGGCSPYLNDVLRRQQDWLQVAVTRNDACADAFSGLSGAPDHLARTLRIAKARIAAYLAMAELSGAQDLLTTTRALTDFADTCVQRAMDQALSDFQTRGVIPVDFPWFVLAMGKMGAGELNYSSDIDLIVMFDDSDMSQSEAATYRGYCVKAVRKAMALLSERTEDGYVFRTDLRLRPNPSVTPICVGVKSALQYYESVGRTWERAAFIKARVCAGNMQAGQNLLSKMEPFVWRKYLDFAAIEEAHDLRLKIRDQKGFHGDITLAGHDMKLGRGGIREIEFFTQTRQLISGGRDARLRTLQTCDALAALVDTGWVDELDADILTRHYIRHRHVEHAIQMIHDAQTQSLPYSPAGMAQVAGLMGQSLDAFEHDCFAALTAVHDITDRFFETVATADATELDILAGHQANDVIEGWHQLPAFRSERAVAIFERLRPKILQGLNAAADPMGALLDFDAFLAGLPAGVQLFSLFQANPKLVDMVTKIAATAPGLARYLGRNASVFDAVIGGEFFQDLPKTAEYEHDLNTVLTPTSDYETALNTARIWTREQHFRIGVHLLERLIPPHMAQAQYSALADAVIGAILPVVTREHERRFGQIEGGRLAVMAMGSLGAARLNSDSDLDLMIIFDADPHAESDGKKNIYSRQYYSKLTQSLITALSAPMKDGTLYEVDMRLRPSGRAGPVATSFAGFKDYQLNEAWAWEHFALTLARPIAGDTALQAELQQARDAILHAKADWPKLREGLLDMRRRLAVEKPSKTLWDVKRGAGGLQDIELTGQALSIARQALNGSGPEVLAQIAPQLLEDYRKMSDLRTIWTLLCKDDAHEFELGSGGWSLVAHHCGVGHEDALSSLLDIMRSRTTSTIEALLTQDRV